MMMPGVKKLFTSSFIYSFSVSLVKVSWFSVKSEHAVLICKLPLYNNQKIEMPTFPCISGSSTVC